MTALLCAKQLAKHLGISLRTLDTLDRNGELPVGFRVGHLRRWRIVDVDDWIDKKLIESRPHRMQ